MTLIKGNVFIEALRNAGLLPEHAYEVTIVARFGEPVRMEYGIYADERLIGASAIEPTDDPNEAIAR